MASLEAENHIGAAFRVCLKMNTNLSTQLKGVKTPSDMTEKSLWEKGSVSLERKCVCKCKDCPDLLIEVLLQSNICMQKTSHCFPNFKIPHYHCQDSVIEFNQNTKLWRLPVCRFF